MNIQEDRTLQETRTTLGASDVIAAAKVFFARRNSLYAAFVEKEGPAFVSLRGQGGDRGVGPLVRGAGAYSRRAKHISLQILLRQFRRGSYAIPRQ